MFGANIATDVVKISLLTLNMYIVRDGAYIDRETSNDLAKSN